MQADPRIKVGSVVRADPGNDRSSQWVVQEIRYGQGGIEWFGRGLGPVFPEPMHTNQNRPPELVWEHWAEVVGLPSMDPRFAAQVKWLAAPAHRGVGYDELVKWNRQWMTPQQPKPIAPPPPPEYFLPTTDGVSGPMAVPADVANQIRAAGYLIDRIDRVSAGDTIWCDGPRKLGGSSLLGAWALIIKAIDPPPVRDPKGSLYVQPWGNTGGFQIGLTPDHYLILSREEAITVIERLSELVGYVKGHP